MRGPRHRGRRHGHLHHRHHWKRLDRNEKIERLESYQRDLEQQAADVATLINRLREEAPAPA